MHGGHSRFIALAILACGLISGPARAQDDLFGGPASGSLGRTPAMEKLEVTASFTAATEKQPARLYVIGDIRDGWHTYSLTQAAGGPKRTTITLEKSDAFKLAGDFTPSPKPEVHTYPDIWPDLKVEEHEGKVIWHAPIEIARGVDPKTLKIEGRVNAMLCKESCDPPKNFPFQATLTEKVELPAGDEQAAASVGEYQPPDSNATIRGYLDPPVAAAGGTTTLYLTAIPEPGWHVYALADRDPLTIGAGKPTLIEVQLPEGFTAQRPEADVRPTAKPSVNNPGQMDQLYGQPVTWAVKVQVPEGTASGQYPVEGIIGYQTCDENTCDFPRAARFQAEIAVGASDAGSRVPLRFTEAKYAEASKLAASRPVEFDESRLVLSTPGQESRGVIFYLAFGFLGGLILNLMPCVLPVVGLKILAFVEQGGHDRGRIFMLNLWYTLGLMSVFMILATLPVVWSLAFGQQFVWGQQFGNDAFSITLAALVFAMGLSLIGVWEIPIPGFVGSGKAAHLAQKEGVSGAFAKGAITTVLATPCSGPFLGTALGWAFKQPPYVIYGVFACVGLGMASPYLVIGAFPRLIRLLPKPGAWMETFKQFMGFILLGTVVYLLTLIHWTYLVPTVALLVGIWAACWWIGRVPLTADFPRKAGAWGFALALIALVTLFSFNFLDDVMASRYENDLVAQMAARLKDSGGKVETAVKDETSLPWQPFSREKLKELASERKTVIVDFTAKWCPNCLTLKKLVLNTPAVKEVVEERGIVPLVADLDASPENPEMLTALDAGSIPVLAIFPAGRPNEPIVFRDGYTQQMLLDALDRAGPSATAGGETVTAMRD